jgi:membrane protease YdiL (CAAX protease family)
MTSEQYLYFQRGTVKMIKRFFSTDSSYKEQIAHYDKIDGMLALALYAVLMVAYYFMGILFVQKNLYLGVPINLLMIVLCIVLVLIRKQRLNSIGVTAKNVGRALLIGMVFGILFSLAMNVIPSILTGGKVITLSAALYNIFYYFVVIALSEEIVFRGYIQTRIYGLIKHDILAIFITAFLFYAMHLPFQMVAYGMQINIVNMVTMIALHFVMNFLYRKYNSLAAPTIFHGLLDWGGNLLR